ncbi:hypothetical protein LTR85_007448 [Meristemomyces frigidus]|nr:hypothetical protein LTR85_007448 [Meristemomyces frigidus]
MATSAITDLYQRYKTGTKCVVQWLAETAGRRADLTSLLPRVNGDSHEHSAVVRLSSADLLRLAEGIATSVKPKRPAPTGIDVTLSVLEHVIAGRRECSEWYRCNADNEGKDAAKEDKSHRHFVDVLETVLHHLSYAHQHSHNPSSKKGKGKQERKQKFSASPEEASANIFCTIFERLGVEEPAEDVPSHAVFVSPPAAKSQVEPVVKTFELETQEADRDFVLCLPVASKVTDKAFTIIRLAAEEFAHDFPMLACFTQVAKHLNIKLKAKGILLEEFACDDAGLVGASTEFSATAELLCIPAYTTLSVIRQSRNYPQGQAGRMIESQEFADACHPMATRIMDAKVAFTLLRDRILDFCVSDGLDAFTIDVLPSLSQQRLPLNAVVHFQIYMDLVDLVGEAHGLEYEGLVAVTDAVSISIERFEKEATSFKEACIFPTDADRSILRNTVKRRIAKGLEEPKIDAGVAGPGKDGPSGLPLFAPLLVQFPVMCGWYSRSITEPIYADGVFTCNNALTMIAMAHVYTACHDTGLLKGDWEDMEFLIKQQGAENLGLRRSGEAVRSLESMARHYGLALGVEVRQYGRSRARGNNDTRVRLPALAQIWSRAKQFRPTSPFLAGLHDSANKSGGAEVHPSRRIHEALYRMTKKIIDRPDGNVDSKISAQWHTCKTLTPEQLLSTLKDALLADELNLNFNRHGLFIACARFLEGAKERVGPTTDELRRREGLSEDYFAFEMVDEVLWEAARTNRLSARYLKANTMLGTIAIGLQRFINLAGSQWLNWARHIVDAQLCKSGSRSVAARKGEAASDDMRLTLEGGRLEMATRELSTEELKRRADAEAAVMRMRRGGKTAELGLSFLNSLAGGKSMRDHLMPEGCKEHGEGEADGSAA